MKFLKILYNFKSIKFKQYRCDKTGEKFILKNGFIQTIVNLNIKNICHSTFVTSHKYTLISWIMMFKKLPSMINFLKYYV